MKTVAAVFVFCAAVAIGWLARSLSAPAPSIGCKRLESAEARSRSRTLVVYGCQLSSYVVVDQLECYIVFPRLSKVGVANKLGARITNDQLDPSSLDYTGEGFEPDYWQYKSHLTATESGFKFSSINGDPISVDFQ